MSNKIIAAVDDMLFASKIRAVAEQLGLTVQFAKSASAVVEAVRKEKPSVIVVDLHSQRCQPLELARELKANKELSAIPMVGFFSHVETALQVAAQEAGYDHVMPRSAFTRNLPEILRGRF